MKHTKKMVMVPEVEYLTLLSMLKGDDPHKTEKANIDAKIQQNFNNENITEDVRARKYDWLLKQKRKLRELIEGKPQKVVIENLPIGPNVAPYMGINQNATPTIAINNNKKRKLKSRPRQNLTNTPPTGSSSMETGSSISATSEDDYYSTDETLSPRNLRRKMKYDPIDSPSSPLINLGMYDKLMDHVEKNKDKYGILNNGSILTNFKKPVGDSNYIDALKYFTGQISTPPKGSYFLRTNLYKDPEFVNEFVTQKGEGKLNRKLIVVKIKPIKTPGLKREKKLIFKPRFWAKL